METYEIESTMDMFSNNSEAYAYLQTIIAESAPDYFDRDEVRFCENILLGIDHFEVPEDFYIN